MGLGLGVLGIEVEAPRGGKRLKEVSVSGIWVSGFIPRGSKVVPFWGSYIESYKLIRKRNYYGAYGWFVHVAEPSRVASRLLWP